MIIKNTRSFTDANGTQFIIDLKTRKIISTMDKHGFIYNAKGIRTGNIHGHAYLDGCYY